MTYCEPPVFWDDKQMPGGAKERCFCRNLGFRKVDIPNHAARGQCTKERGHRKIAAAIANGRNFEAVNRMALAIKDAFETTDFTIAPVVAN